ncbi:MAG: transcriptional regulator NrdR [Propioniciclava sp.]|uniref:transcriptional regulator NrdR n=1 Tax=Propioniciclava sp. TaxID=2038686 RepID=UPI0039E686E7
MYCPYCRHVDSRVLDSRVTEDGSAIRRRRECRSCLRRFTTLEQMQLVVVKRSGVIEPFSREKVVNGVRKACKGRPVTEADLAKLGQKVEETIRASGQAEIPADDVGIAILGPLKELDPIAYLRFASVYRQYKSVDDFEAEIALLRESMAAALAATPATEAEPVAEASAEAPVKTRKTRARKPRVAEPEPEAVAVPTAEQLF